MAVLERDVRDGGVREEHISPIVRSNSAVGRPAAEQPDSTLLRKICLQLSNAILQFPVVFELQQKSLSQPTLLRREVEDDLAKYEASGESGYLILDYGCGSGTYSGLCNPDNYLGIDCNQGMLERAASQNPRHSFVNAENLDEIGSTLNSVVHILMVGVIHHLSAENFVQIMSAVPNRENVSILAIDTLRSTSLAGRAVQLFERGEYLREEREHLALLDRVAELKSYKRVPYGRFFELAVFRGVLRK